jgi:preprotein translocase subunit SecA
MMGRFGIPEDEPIDNRFITSTLESAQAKIEGFHFDARKHTLEYDDVMNHQRKVVYERRRVMLEGNYDNLQKFLDELCVQYPNLKEIAAEKRTTIGDANFFETVRRISLYVTDTLWVEHLESMEYARSSVNLRAYGQREPLIEYKKEGLRLFREMEAMFKEQVMSLISTMNVQSEAPEQVTEERPPLILSAPDDTGNIPMVPKTDNKVGRNDPCPCGSGKKYKKCGMLNTEEHKKFSAKK